MVAPSVWLPASADPDLRHCFDTLRSKWGEVPAGDTRVQSVDLMTLSDHALNAYWDTIHTQSLEHRHWFETLYADVFRGKRVLDVGCGLAISTLYFAMNGAKMTFLDIVQQNVRIVERLCRIKGVDAQFFFAENLADIGRSLDEYDVIFCCGSLINAPLDLMRMEAQALLAHLAPRGRWIELAYPKQRWLREGSLPFLEWGNKTDGGAPWMEWHDLAKVLWYLHPAKFHVILDLEFHDSDFNWFDLQRID